MYSTGSNFCVFATYDIAFEDYKLELFPREVSLQYRASSLQHQTPFLLEVPHDQVTLEHTPVGRCATQPNALALRANGQVDTNSAARWFVLACVPDQGRPHTEFLT